MRAPLALISDLSRPHANQPVVDARSTRRSEWIWLGYIVMSIALLIATGFSLERIIRLP